jgi:hypothetical protein
MVELSQVKFVKVYAAHGDGGERAQGPIIGYFSSAFKASNYARNAGFYGSDGGTSIVPAVNIDGKIYVLSQEGAIDLDGEQVQRDANLRAQTIASLSVEQLRVLGLLQP